MTRGQISDVVSTTNSVDVPPTWTQTGVMPIFRALDAVTVPVPDIDAGLRFCRDALGHPLLWRNDAAAKPVSPCRTVTPNW